METTARATGERAGGRDLLRSLIEEVLIHTENRESLPLLHSDPIPKHESSKTYSIDEDDAALELTGCVLRCRREPRSCDEDATIGTLSCERAVEGVDVWGADRVVVSA